LIDRIGRETTIGTICRSDIDLKPAGLDKARSKRVVG
jgi:hypothetical protein